MSLLNWFVFSLIGGFCFGLHAVLVRLVLTERFTPMVVNTYFFTLGTLILWVYSAYSRSVSFPDLRTGTMLFIIAVVAVVGFWGLFKAYALAPNLGYVRAVFSVNIVVSFVLSSFLLGSRFSLQALLGMALVILGTVVLALA
jgi:uncharacterized membrane protein